MIDRLFRRAVEQAIGGLIGPWQNWTPTYGGSGSLTFTSVTTGLARYMQIGKTVFFQLKATGTTGGTTSTAIFFVPPVATLQASVLVGGGCRVVDGSTLSGFWFNNTTTQFFVRRYDNGNWGLGAGRIISVQGFYEVA